MEAVLLKLDYTFSFADTCQSPNPIQFINHHTGEQAKATVFINYQRLLEHYHFLPDIIVDCLDLAATLYFADSRALRRRDQTCRIQVKIPVRQYDTWRNPQNLTQLQNILNHYTDDEWHFEFVQRTDSPPTKCEQLYLSLGAGDAVEVVLWSGGLDALAGLCNRLLAQPETQFMLVGTGANTFIQSRQKEISHSLEVKFPGRIRLVQLPIALTGTNNKSVNSCQRSRGFVFLLLGAICAYMEEQRTLHVYENGVGAINLPYRASELGLDHTRSVHPVSLIKMSDFISQLLDTSFQIVNPFEAWTKGQMCASLVALDTVDLIKRTISCDRRRREVVMQCGRCSSCLLRRQALAAAGIKDETDYAINDFMSKEKLERLLANTHLPYMQEQVRCIRAWLAAPDVWPKLPRHFRDLSVVRDILSHRRKVDAATIQDQLLRLYQCYIDEWQVFERTIA